MNVSHASCPASLSFIFKILPNKDLTKTGSIGVGCTVDKEVVVTAEKANVSEIVFNGQNIKFPTVESVVAALAPVAVKVEINSPLPLGFGFGISGASALATAYALNNLLNLKRKKPELAEIAHIAEIVNRTGLGSVGTQITGGFLLKKTAGLPVDAVRFPFAGRRLYAFIFNKLETPTILNDKNRLEKINKAADEALAEVRENRQASLGKIIDISCGFAQKSGLLVGEEVASLIGKIRNRGGHATMLMLGEVVISDTLYFFKNNYSVVTLTVSDRHI